MRLNLPSIKKCTRLSTQSDDFNTLVNFHHPQRYGDFSSTPPPSKTLVPFDGPSPSSHQCQAAPDVIPVTKYWNALFSCTQWNRTGVCALCIYLLFTQHVSQIPRAVTGIRGLSLAVRSKAPLHVCTVTYPFTWQRVFELSSVFSCYTHRCTVLCTDVLFISRGCSWDCNGWVIGSVYVYFIRSCQIIFHSSCTILIFFKKSLCCRGDTDCLLLT